MALKVVWTEEARKNLEAITQYLEYHWTEQELRRFFRALEDRLLLISQQPKAFRLTDPKKVLRASVLTKQTTIFYTIESNPDHITIQSLFDTRQDPDELKL